MPSTYTSNNGLEKPGIGEQDGTWGSSLNNDIDLLDQSLDGVSPITLTGGTYSLTVTDGAPSNGRCRVILFTGTPVSAVSVSITPVNINKVYWIVNQSNQDITLSNGSGSTLVVPLLTTAPAFCDGAGNVIGLQAGNNSFSSLEVSGETHLDGPVFIGFVPLATLVSIADGNVNFTLESVSGSGVYIIATFGTSVGTRSRLAVGFGGGVSSGFVIPVPSGFPGGNILCGASLGAAVATAGNNIGRVLCATTGPIVTVSTSDQTGGVSYASTANWWAVSWMNNY